MTLTDKLAALPSYYRTMDELAEAEGESSAIRLMILQNEALHAYNALLCEALEIACSAFDYMDGEPGELRAVIAACEVRYEP